jgi:hypothetical protein
MCLSSLQKLIDLQNTRGGRVKLNTMTMPETEFDHPEKGGWVGGWVGSHSETGFMAGRARAGPTHVECCCVGPPAGWLAG